MSVAQPLPRPPAEGPDRLHGWKEIAAYLGRGVRTVQRWERELGLPVYRLVTKGSEVVYARRTELDAWLSSTDRTRVAGRPDEQSDVPLMRRQVTRLDLGWAALLIAVVVVLLMGLAGNLTLPVWPFGGPAGPAQPVSGRFDHQRLQVFDAQGAPVWEHAFEFPVDEGVYRTGFLADGQSPAIAIDDVNGDGAAEVLMVPWATDTGNRRLYCFGPRGAMLFTAPVLTAGPSRLAGRSQEFAAGRFLITGEANGGKSIWLTVPHVYRPETVLQRLDGRGRVVSEYASSGAVTFLKALDVAGHRVLMVGGTSSDLQSASLAVLDYAQAGGADPLAATGGVPACDACSTARPLAFLTFPRLDVATTVSRPPLVNGVQPRRDGGFDVSVLQARIGIGSDRPFTSAAVVYSFSSDLRLDSAMATEGYLQAHSDLQLAGSLAHPFGDTDRRAFFPLQVWRHDRFEPLFVGDRVNIDR